MNYYYYFYKTDCDKFCFVLYDKVTNKNVPVKQNNYEYCEKRESSVNVLSSSSCLASDNLNLKDI